MTFAHTDRPKLYPRPAVRWQIVTRLSDIYRRLHAGAHAARTPPRINAVDVQTALVIKSLR